MGYIPESDGKSKALWVMEVCHKVGSMCSVLSEKVLRLFTREVVKYIPEEGMWRGEKGTPSDVDFNVLA